MKQIIVAFTGISGVGKTTFLKKLTKEVPFQHLTAGSLIARAREVSTENRDDLRKSDLDENQRFLIEGFKIAKRGDANLVIMDGHVLVHGGNGIYKVPAKVFRELSIGLMIHLESEPGTIYKNRKNDSSRERPDLSVLQLQHHQNLSRHQAQSISESLHIDNLVVRHDDIDLVSDHLSKKLNVA